MNQFLLRLKCDLRIYFVMLQPKADIKLADSRLIMQRTSIHILLIAELFQQNTDPENQSSEVANIYVAMHLTYGKLEQSPRWGRVVPLYSPPSEQLELQTRYGTSEFGIS